MKVALLIHFKLDICLMYNINPMYSYINIGGKTLNGAKMSKYEKFRIKMA